MASIEGKNEMKRYKENLAKSLLDYREQYDFDPEGIIEFARDNDIPLKIDHEVTVTITFSARDVLIQGDLEDQVDEYCRSITETHFMSQYIESKIAKENYGFAIEEGR